MANYYTDMWSLLKAVKFQLMEFREDGNMIQIGKGPEMNWGLGYVLPKTVFPVITVFPLEKRFGPRRGGGVSTVDYRMSVDIYSPKYNDMQTAKAYTLRAVDDVTNCCKGAITMPDAEGKLHCFNTTLISIDTAEKVTERGRNFQSISTVTLSCSAYHKMDENRVRYTTKKQTDPDDFMDKVCSIVRDDYDGVQPAAWQYKISKPVTKNPTVQILSGEEVHDDSFGIGSLDNPLERWVFFNVISSEYPRTKVLKRVIAIADSLQAAIERTYMVDGYARNCVVDNIVYDHTMKPDGFEFYATMLARYECLMSFDRIIH